MLMLAIDMPIIPDMRYVCGEPLATENISVMVPHAQGHRQHPRQGADIGGGGFAQDRGSPGRPSVRGVRSGGPGAALDDHGAHRAPFRSA